MNVRKQRKVDIEYSVWEEDDFFIGVGPIVMCLICGNAVVIFGSELHFISKHEGNSANFSTDTRARKAKELASNLQKENNVQCGRVLCEGCIPDDLA
jgi:hypothetical protein